jgi:hypothetical protein
MRGPDLTAEGFCVVDSGLTFDVDEYEVVFAFREHGQAFDVVESGLDVEAGETENLIAEGAKHLATAYMEDCGFGGLGVLHFASEILPIWGPCLTGCQTFRARGWNRSDFLISSSDILQEMKRRKMRAILCRLDDTVFRQRVVSVPGQGFGDPDGESARPMDLGILLSRVVVQVLS